MSKIFAFLLIFLFFGAIILIAAKPVVAPLGKLTSVITKPKTTSILATGDVMLGRTVMTTSLDKGDPTYAFGNVAQKLQNADITIVNLENPIVENCPRRVDGMIFCADPTLIEGLKYSGVDIVNLANNHTQNHGKEGFEQTKSYLDQSGISYVGDGNLVIKDINGTKFGFIGFEKSQQGSPKLTPNEIELIKQADTKSDVLVVSIHWGVEYQNTALPGQRNLARELVERGSDVIIGHHPHWVQDNELIDGKPVYYSLGNFIFDQMWSEETKKGLVVKFDFEEGKLVNKEELPIYMSEWAKPMWVE